MRKAAHFTEYAILGFLRPVLLPFCAANFCDRDGSSPALLLVVLYALLDEFHQSFVPSRTASIYDSVIDIAGGLVGLVGFAYFSRRAAACSDRATAA